MAKDAVKQILADIFNDRRYCLDCKAMTPIQDYNGRHRDQVCQICECFYEAIFRNVKIQETYGMAIYWDI